MTEFNIAWADYLSALDEARSAVQEHPASQNPDLRAAGLYLPQQLQSIAFNMYLAPRPAAPRLYQSEIFSLYELNWGMPNPDYVYRFAFLDGAYRYRLSGPRHSTNAWLNLQAFRGWWGDPDNSQIADIDLDRTKGSGPIEVILGPPGGADVDITLDPGNWNHVLNIRESIEDWEKDEKTPLLLERIGGPIQGALHLSEAHMAERLQRAAQMVRGVTQRSLSNHDRLVKAAAGVNCFYADVPSAVRSSNNAHGAQTMNQCIFDLQADAALVITGILPQKVRYWGIQVADMWWRTADWSSTQSSLNRKTAHIAPDGSFVIVLAHQDTGIVNWLDTTGLQRGQICNRLNLASDNPGLTAQVVPFSELSQHIPEDMPRISPAERAQIVARRHLSAISRFSMF